ncbi:MAG TPA: type IV pilus modification protein PilV [Burkholderiaceae bacterium]|nr:type IV pilus modification protein PilV [Burkholderiaceae bacterium]
MLTSSMPRRSICRADGFTLIEVLISVLILMIGLLGVAGLQGKAVKVEFESYQRAQALTLARDMAGRIAGSRGIVTAGYLDGSVSSTDGSVYFGSGSGATDYSNGAGACVLGGTTALAKAKYEVCQWGLALQGSNEKEGASNVGAMIGARGCLLSNDTSLSGALADFYVVVVWQATSAGTEPSGMVSGEPASPGSQCASAFAFGSGLRRAVTVRVMVPNLVSP